MRRHGLRPGGAMSTVTAAAEAGHPGARQAAENIEQGTASPSANTASK